MSRTTYPLHPACAAWPEMEPRALAELSDDIFEHGLREPITITPANEILDGRNRDLACLQAGVEPTFVVYEGDPYLFSLSKNKHRRHMSASDIAMVAAGLATRDRVGERGADGKFTDGSKELSVAEAAKAAGIPETAVKRAKVVLDHGTPEEIEAVKTGKAKLRPTADAVRARKKKDAKVNNVVPITKASAKPADSATDLRNREMERLHYVDKLSWVEIAKLPISGGMTDKACSDAVSRQRKKDGKLAKTGKVKELAWNAEPPPNPVLKKIIEKAVADIKSAASGATERAYAVASIMVGLGIQSTQGLYPHLKRLDSDSFGESVELTIKM
jgi:ParB/Sulfiredoxin domain